jgi:poly-gamma-glutamate synthesis protein (capsule biosynthesis protein)
MEPLAGHKEWVFPTDPQQAALRLEVGGEHPASRWVYALVAPFITLAEGISSDELRRAWRGEAAGPFAGKPIRVEGGTLALFTALWGAPAEGAVQVGVVAPDLAFTRRRLWAIVPFEALDPRWKVLEVDGQSPLHKDFDPAAYSLSVPFTLSGDPGLAAQVAPLLPVTNRDPARLSVVALTGTTALVRATAYTMEQRGVKYPAKDVGDILRSADITHVSNEVAFAKDCPTPDPLTQDMRFCSDPRYIELLDAIGTDVVELTGDHFQDWGVEAMRYTLQLYQERGWKHYGGGANLEDARQPLLIEHDGNRLAFLGCNAKGGSFAQAAPKHPGAAPCDMDWLAAEIARLSQDGYLPIVTFQHYEYYTYQPQPDQERDFRRAAEFGAVIVSGSQAHQPQGMEFIGDHFIHYGLGNLFFDQYDVSAATRQAFIDLHVFYAGRYIGVELLPIVFVDYARPRPMTADEANELLEAVFSASGW